MCIVSQYWERKNSSVTLQMILTLFSLLYLTLQLLAYWMINRSDCNSIGDCVTFNIHKMVCTIIILRLALPKPGRDTTTSLFRILRLMKPVILLAVIQPTHTLPSTPKQSPTNLCCTLAQESVSFLLPWLVVAPAISWIRLNKVAIGENHQHGREGRRDDATEDIENVSYEARDQTTATAFRSYLGGTSSTRGPGVARVSSFILWTCRESEWVGETTEYLNKSHIIEFSFCNIITNLYSGVWGWVCLCVCMCVCWDGRLRNWTLNAI